MILGEVKKSNQGEADIKQQIITHKAKLVRLIQKNELKSYMI